MKYEKPEVVFVELENQNVITGSLGQGGTSTDEDDGIDW